MAATTAAPEEMPHSRPSSSARRRAMSMLSWLDTHTTSSSMAASSTLGTKPAPMPWICARRDPQRHDLALVIGGSLVALRRYMILSAQLIREPVFAQAGSRAAPWHTPCATSPICEPRTGPTCLVLHAVALIRQSILERSTCVYGALDPALRI